MSCQKSIKLSSCPSGTTWDGLTDCQFTTTGTALDDSLSSVVMEFADANGTVGLTLSSADNEININDAATWQFEVLEVTPMPLASGIWNWKIRTTDSSNRIKEYARGTIEII